MALASPPSGPAFRNARAVGRLDPGSAIQLQRATPSGEEIYGVASGLNFDKYRPDAGRVDARWAPLESERIAARMSRCVWRYGVHAHPSENEALEAALERKGARTNLFILRRTDSASRSCLVRATAL
jgi:hypothetical protein